MLPPILGEIPFPRGATAADGLMTPTSTWRQEIEGKAYWVPDTQHDSSEVMLLLCVRNETGGSITVERKFGEFKLDAATVMAKQFGTFPCNNLGEVALPIDDAYTDGATIVEHDLFHVVLRGWCNVLSGSVTNFWAGMGVCTNSTGLINDALQVPAGSFVIGRLDYAASYSANSECRVWVDPAGLAPASA